MAFFSESSPNVSQQDLDWAERLRVLLVTHRRTTRARVGVWANEFRLLRKRWGSEEIETVLSWLEQCLTEKYTPAVFSAATFREKFPQLVLAMERERPPDEVVITDEARKVALRLGDLIWANEEKKDELKTIQLSLDVYRQFLSRLRSNRERWPGLVDHLVSVGGDVPGFVETWIRNVHTMAMEWSNWEGNLPGLAIRIGSPRFRRVLNAWVSEYMGPGDYWQEIEELLK